jgi:hypothetical protein
MSADVLLSRLDGVRRTGPDRWLARCPAHEDRRASLSLRELADGRVLLHCFALCRPDEVLDALGIDWSALFPVDSAGKKFKKAPGIPASDILKALDFESLVVAVIAADMIKKREISDQDYERLSLACQRIGAARGAGHG